MNQPNTYPKGSMGHMVAEAGGALVDGNFVISPDGMWRLWANLEAQSKAREDRAALLAALKPILLWAPGCDRSPMWEAARAAVAKAER